MKCRDIQLVLADYAGNTLTGPERSRIEDHLAACAGCREELLFIKKYMKGIAAYPTIDAPDDFLAGVRARLHEPKDAGFGRTLFLPLRIKLPLHAAGVLALSIIALFIFRPLGQEPAYRTAESPLAHVEEEASRPLSLENRPSRDIGRTAKKGRAATDQIEERVTVTAPGPMMPVLSEGEKDKKSPDTDTDAKAGHPVAIALFLTREAPSGSLPYAGDTLMSTRSSSRAEKRDAESKESDEPGVRARDGERDLGAITVLTDSLDGTVTDSRRDDATGALKRVTVELPASRYDRFLRGLRGRWHVKEGHVDSPPPREGAATIIIHLDN